MNFLTNYKSWGGGKTIDRNDYYVSPLLHAGNLLAETQSAIAEIATQMAGSSSLRKSFEPIFVTSNQEINHTTLVSSKNRGQFVYDLISFLVDNDIQLPLLECLVEKNQQLGSFNIELESNRLTSIFRVSSTELDLDDLTSGDKLRYFEDKFELDSKFYYLSNQWTDGTNSRLDIQTLISIFHKLYTSYKIVELNGSYSLIYIDSKPVVVFLSKPFLLLAGISGTGKTRFIRGQASKTDSNLNNYCLTPVRPDWHEPSDLLGYVSRLGQNGAEFISTDVLNFIIKAWKAINPSTIELESNEFRNKELAPFWLCLDEMNLAPVEQYFADYLAILETRKWDNGVYTCDALLKPEVITLLPETNQSKLRADWDLQEPEFDGLWAYFLNYGIPIPFNLIVAGTVNMDETTHGFSRKVIDRALTFDFGQFYPNEFSNFFTATKQAKVLGYPLYTQAKLEDFSNIVCDNDAQKTITFIQGLNRILKNTLFELAYRALNELLLSVISFQPTTEQELLAVWDDFLMCKVLPRIEGDEDKLTSDGKPLLTELSGLLNQAGQLKPIWDSKRPDLLREDIGSLSKPILIECRSRKKIEWMQLRLTLNGFTSFWP